MPNNIQDYLRVAEKTGQIDLYWQTFDEERRSGFRRLFSLMAEPRQSFGEFMETPLRVWSESSVKEGDISTFSLKEADYYVDIKPSDMLGYANGVVYARVKEMFPNIRQTAKGFIAKEIQRKAFSVGQSPTGDEIKQWIIDNAPSKTEKLLCLDYKNAVLFDGGSRDDGEVTIPDGIQPLLKGGTIYHSHPEGTSLSPADILIAIKYNLKRMYAIGIKDGQTVAYILSRPDTTWGSGTYANIEAWLDNVDNNGLPQNGIPPHYAMEDKRHIINSIMATELGLDYKAKVFAGSPKPKDLQGLAAKMGKKSLKQMILSRIKGGEGSGFFGHAGRPGKQGGSLTQDGSQNVLVLAQSQFAYPMTGPVDLSGTVYTISADGKQEEADPVIVRSLERDAAKLPKGALDSINNIFIAKTDSDFDKLFNAKNGQSTDFDASSVAAFRTPEHELYFRHRTALDTSLFYHEVGHEVLEMALDKGDWYIAYRNQDFDRHTWYSRHDVREGFAESFSAFMSTAGQTNDPKTTGTFKVVHQVIMSRKTRKKEFDSEYPQIIVNIPPQPAPIVYVTFKAPDGKISPVFNVPVPEVNMAPAIEVVQMPSETKEAKPIRMAVKRDADGKIVGLEEV